MSGFDPEWLDLREPADAAARSIPLAETLRAALAGNPAGRQHGGAVRDATVGAIESRTVKIPADERRGESGPVPLVVVTDLGGGTGANLRWLAPRLGGRQAWRVVDNDAALLDALPGRIERWARAGRIDMRPARRATPGGNAGRTEQLSGAGTATRHAADTPRSAGLRLTADDWQATVALIAADLAADPVPVEPVAESVVTASALLDLVSADWLDRLVAALAGIGAAAAFALTYDGRIELDPAHPRDADLRSLVNAHQRRDKGFGPALGPDAAAAAGAAMTARGFRVESVASDWLLDASQPALSLALLEGWTAAAAEQAPDAADWLGEWLDVRRSHIAAGRLRIRVGHRDLLGLPPARMP